MTTTVTKETIRSERSPGRGIPEDVMFYIATHPDRFQPYISHDKDTERFIATSRKNLQREDAEQLAWLCWRARIAQGWTREKGVITLPWDMAVLHAWENDELMKTCLAKRKLYYAELKAREERLSGAFDEQREQTNTDRAKDELESQRAMETNAAITADKAAE